MALNNFNMYKSFIKHTMYSAIMEVTPQHCCHVDSWQLQCCSVSGSGCSLFTGCDNTCSMGISQQEYGLTLRQTNRPAFMK